jgi:8-hydroxy-5-deazaflavin:NADPH oxidoreductase
MSMKIGIVGAGRIGGTLVRKLRASGHEVRAANSRGPESLSGLAAETGATAVTAAEVAAGVEVLIVSVRFQQLTALKPVISAVANDITVVDTSNYLPVSGQPEQYGASPVEAIDAGQPEAAWLQEQWGRPVIRAWNAQFAYTLADMGKARGEPGRLALPVAGDSADSKLRPGAPSSPPTSSARPSVSPTEKPPRSAATQQGRSSGRGRIPRTSRTGSGCTAQPPASPRPMTEHPCHA